VCVQANPSTSSERDGDRLENIFPENSEATTEVGVRWVGADGAIFSPICVLGPSIGDPVLDQSPFCRHFHCNFHSPIFIVALECEHMWISMKSAT